MMALEIECLCGRTQMVPRDHTTGGGLRVTLYAGNCGGCGRRISAGIGAPPSRRDAPLPPEVLADAHQEPLPIAEGRSRPARAVRARDSGHRGQPCVATEETAGNGVKTAALITTPAMLAGSAPPSPRSDTGNLAPQGDLGPLDQRLARGGGA